MKVLVQDTLASPGEWRTLNSAAWVELAKKPEPVGGEIIDDQPGWIYAINVQGVKFIGDYIVVLDRPDGGCEVIAANVDPGDWAPPDMYVQHWTFLPLVPDPLLGGAINTRQSRIVYAGSRAKAKFKGTQNTTVLPFGQFVRPTEGLVRYGIWLTNALSDAHVAARSIKGWRDWGGHLDTTEVDEQGRVKIQRDLGRWSKAKGTITYIQRDTDRAVGYGAFAHEDALESATATASSETATISQNSTNQLAWSFATPSNEPNVVDWPNGTYRCQFDCTAAGDNLLYRCKRVGLGDGFDRVNSALSSVLERVDQAEDDFSGTGLKLATVSWDPAAGDAADRFAVHLIADNAAEHMDEDITLELNTSDSFADGPWVAPSAPTIHLVMAPPIPAG